MGFKPPIAREVLVSEAFENVQVIFPTSLA